MGVNKLSCVYFKILVSNLTKDMLDKLVGNKGACLKKTTDGTYTMTKYARNNVPSEISKLDLKPLNHAEARIEILTEAWGNSE